MAAVTGSWKNAQVGQQILATQWGTGYNPIHAQRTGEGRNIAPDGSGNLVDPNLTSGDYSISDLEGYGYALEDQTSVLWGYGTETGTADRPELGDNYDMNSSSTDIPSTRTPFPTWGHYPQGVPGGTAIRAEDHGAETAYTSKQEYDESVANGWMNKETSEINDAGISDPSQYIMQTSMVQRDKTRAGSQAAEGRENQYDAPIHSRIVPMIEKVWSDDPERRYAMTPKVQDMVVRPWYMRTAGTGRVQDMRVNEVMFNSPQNRRPPEPAYVGEMVGASDASSYGYTPDDLSWGY